MTIGVDLSKMNTIGDLQGGIEEAERLLGFTVIRPEMPTASHEPPGPALVSILRRARYLIASIHTALDDSQLVRFQQDLIEQIGRHRSRGVIIDVAALDVLDSFGSRTLRNIAEIARLRGAQTVIVGIQPDVAFAMVQLGIRPEPAHRTRPRGGDGAARGHHSRRRVPPREGRRPVTSDLARLRQSYRVGFLRYLSRRDELTLHTAYELGRRGLATGVSLLDLVQIHHARPRGRAARPGSRRAARHRRRRGRVPGRSPRAIRDDPPRRSRPHLWWRRRESTKPAVLSGATRRFDPVRVIRRFLARLLYGCTHHMRRSAVVTGWNKDKRALIDLVSFLFDRIDDDEAAVRAQLTPTAVRQDAATDRPYATGDRGGPVRALRELAAKRMMVEMWFDGVLAEFCRLAGAGPERRRCDDHGPGHRLRRPPALRAAAGWPAPGSRIPRRRRSSTTSSSSVRVLVGRGEDGDQDVPAAGGDVHEQGGGVREGYDIGHQYLPHVLAPQAQQPQGLDGEP